MHNSDIDDQFQMQTINTSVEEIDNQHSMCIYTAALELAVHNVELEKVA